MAHSHFGCSDIISGTILRFHNPHRIFISVVEKSGDKDIWTYCITMIMSDKYE